MQKITAKIIKLKTLYPEAIIVGEKPIIIKLQAPAKNMSKYMNPTRISSKAFNKEIEDNKKATSNTHRQILSATVPLYKALKSCVKNVGNN